MSSEADRPGIVDLRELTSRRAWDTPRLEGVYAIPASKNVLLVGEAYLRDGRYFRVI